MPDGRLREMLCDDAGRVQCPTCSQLRWVEVMRAKQRDPLVACMLLACSHGWHATFDGKTFAAAAPCDCPR
jgi:hypothetical protein